MSPHMSSLRMRGVRAALSSCLTAGVLRALMWHGRRRQGAARPALSFSRSSWSSMMRWRRVSSGAFQPARTRSSVSALRVRITCSDKRTMSTFSAPWVSAACSAATARCQSRTVAPGRRWRGYGAQRQGSWVLRSVCLSRDCSERGAGPRVVAVRDAGATPTATSGRSGGVAQGLRVSFLKVAGALGEQ